MAGDSVGVLLDCDQRRLSFIVEGVSEDEEVEKRDGSRGWGWFSQRWEKRQKW